MKPRLGPAPLTKEDGDIWARVVNRSRRCFSSHDASLYHRVTLGADRRDADLMNWAQTIRRVRDGGYRMLGRLDDRVSSADPNPIDYGGDIARYVR